MWDALSLPFMQRALVAGFLVGALASYFGVFIIQRRLSFMGNGLAHAAFGGVALGVLLGVTPLWAALPFTVAAAVGITWVRDKTELGGDTVVGIFFALTMALGIIFLALKRDYAVEAHTFLFGSILAVTNTDLLITSLLCCLTLAIWPIWRRWAYATFDRELALTDRIQVSRDDYWLSILVALTVVVCVKMVGVVLIAAFLVIPAATARLLARTFFQMTWLSVALGSSSAVAGLLLSYELDLPSGAVIVLLQSALFFGAFCVRKFFNS
ncbi:MAG: metal ABC transporter permease [Candidatus Hinthialibacter antarcticus]|nr:metal ABC transporter permease [Candidatus Hinthialibacter antarcticus]